MSSDQLNKESEQAAASTSAKWEASIKRNPHGDFKTVEASRPPFPAETSVHYVQTPLPSWKFGEGPNRAQPSTASHTPISPYSEGRPAGFNYKLLISAITPRPIAFVSTRSADGKTTNLSPFSYFSVINHDPPLFTIGFSSALAAPKDTLKLLAETEECVINIISEDFIEAANSTSVNAPYGVSEWDVSGLTPAYDCQEVKAARVKEAVFSVECKLESLREFDSRSNPGKKSGCLAILEGVNFWVRSDAINEEGNIVDPAVLRPVSRLGGITYGRTTELFELPRPDFEKDVGGQTAIERLRAKKAEGEKLN
ncbi:hypothetical protein DL546_008017 [Coniochaeta pulveracea]|uniref:Flavin reductase like domain-containing protein n=1 Tax=Coniochaeta pulveracea TaxID=177199 RepID=A0A420YBD4_9PEZI|nr:hypothetical protein DL546_008017 [Coniochaeta pulveracea]